MGRSAWLAAAVLAACNPDEPEGDSGDTDTNIGACGDVGSIPSVDLTGRVRDVDANWVAGVDLTLEEWNWQPGTIHGSGTTDATGTYHFSASNLPVVEDCWGTAVQYWLVGVTDELRGEQPMNPYFIDVWETGSTSINTGDVPLILRAL